MRVRRVVTGHTADGKAIVASDTLVDGITTGLMPGLAFHRIWGADEAPTLPDDGSARAAHDYFPPLGGFRFGLFTLPPASTQTMDPGVDPTPLLAEFEQNLPGMLGTLESLETGMHTTDTVDFEYVVSGEVDLELDDGQLVHLKAGDTVVQNGTRHAWHNRGSVPCTMVVCLVGARRSS